MILPVLIFDLDEHFPDVVALVLNLGSHEGVLLALTQGALNDLLPLNVAIEVRVTELAVLELWEFHQLLYGSSEVT